MPFKVEWGDAAAWAAAAATVIAVWVALASRRHADNAQRRAEAFALAQETAARARIAEAMAVALHGEIGKIVGSMESMRVARRVSVDSASTLRAFRETSGQLESPLLARLPDWIGAFDPPLSGVLAKALGESYSMHTLLTHDIEGLGDERHAQALKAVWTKADAAVETLYEALDLLQPLAARAGCVLLSGTMLRAMGDHAAAIALRERGGHPRGLGS